MGERCAQTRPATGRGVALAGALALTLGPRGAPLAAQAEPEPFDPSRAFISDVTLFERFDVTDTDLTPLRDAVGGGLLVPEAWVVVMDHERGPLALVMDQMAYHHVAQGEMAGEPWMVSF